MTVLSSARTRRLQQVLEAWLQLVLAAGGPVITIPLMLQYVEDCLDLDVHSLLLSQKPVATCESDKSGSPNLFPPGFKLLEFYI